ncbi:NAD-dependent epimerase/dehydratase family protein [Microbacterium sp. DT81.1]|uniref:NAD-dependent epimerase/dehydratase family protein n=1 Tax=Microbacterium sp. DT81.1 TaxID=3393413 RepID=UPI003CF9A2F7
MRVLLAGATGTFGGPLVRELVGAGHEVVGVGRSERGAERLRGLGATPILVDVMDREALLDAVRGERFDAVIHEMTALKKPPTSHGDMRATNALRIDGTAHLLDAARATGATRFVTQSIVFGYGYRDHGTRPLTEDDPFAVPYGNAFDEHLAAMLSTEKQVTTAQGIHGIALRYGLFYGADIDQMAKMLRRRMLPVVRDGGEIPFVHHADAATATLAALERGDPGSVYNIVDDTPATFRDLIAQVAAAKGAPAPLMVPRWLLGTAAPYGASLFAGISMRVSNERAATRLGWRPRYPSVREGVAAS